MYKTKILADSACDLSKELAAELNAERAVPFYLDIGDETFVDDGSLSIADLLAKMKACTTKMGSACPSPAQWMDIFIKAGGGFAVTISSKLSAMYQTAKLGWEMAKNEVPELVGHVFDSKSASCGEVLVAMKIRQFIESGLGFDGVVKKVESFVEEMRTFILLEDVSNVVKNGRMSKIKGTIVNVLGVKPVLCNKDGEIDLFGKFRGSSNVAGKLLDCVAQCKREIKGNELVISHCNNLSLAEELRDEARKRFDFGRILILETGGLTSIYACDRGIILSF
ncbi:MAG: DegV family protein [Gracilibacteraceae bacterium]|jgi:DegV family protein with EDD domain|nr:DegV family protein [Gracilibacteraceae bacterium]